MNESDTVVYRGKVKVKMEEYKLVKLKDIGNLLGLSYEQVKILARTSNMPRIKIGNAAFYRIASVIRWLEEKENEWTIQKAADHKGAKQSRNISG